MLRSIELFTGAGGLALGVARAGFAHDVLVEYDKNACRSLRRNLNHLDQGKCELFEGDVRKVQFGRFAGCIDLLAAGAPCQPFSIGGKHLAQRDERNLFPEVFRAVRECAPRAVLIENVKGLLRASLAEYVEYIELQLALPEVLPKNPADAEAWREHLPRLRRAAKGSSASSQLRYIVSKALLNAADYGVPQRRERVFFVAMRVDLNRSWRRPSPTHSAHALRYDQLVSGEYWREHDLREPRANGENRLQTEDLSSVLRPLMNDRWRTVRDALRGLPEPVAGKESSDWQNHVGQPGARSYAGHTGSALDQPAKTLKAGVHGVPGGENMLRKSNGKVRYFTVREAARIQTFPDEYSIEGAWGEAMRQLGNAVPVSLAAAVARSVREQLSSLGAPAGQAPIRGSLIAVA